MRKSVSNADLILSTNEMQQGTKKSTRPKAGSNHK